MPSPSPTRSPRRNQGRGVLPMLMWAVLIVSVMANSVASVAGSSLTVHLALAAVTAVSVAVLTLVHLRAGR